MPPALDLKRPQACIICGRTVGSAPAKRPSFPDAALIKPKEGATMIPKKKKS